MPRYCRFGRKKRAEYLDLLRQGNRRGMAAEAVGINCETVRLRMRDDLEFAAAVERAETDAHEIVEDALFQAAASGNVTACIFYLCNLHKDKWQNLRRQEITGKDRGNIPLDVKISFGGADASYENDNGEADPDQVS